MKRSTASVVSLLLGLLLGDCVRAGSILEGVKARDVLRCGVSEGIPGFSAQDGEGRWQGLDADFCRAVAAAVLDSPDKVEFVPLKASTRFPALRMGAVDLLLRNTTWTLTREALLQVQFPGVLFYDGQAFMVPAGAGIVGVDDLAGSTVCVEKDTRHEETMAGHFRARGVAVTPLVIDSAAETIAAFFAGRCQAYTSDASQLAAMRLRAPEGPQAFTILEERISKEPLGPVVAAIDAQWFLIVRWVLFTLLEAEERGYTGQNVMARVQEERRLGIRVMTVQEGALVGDALGIRRTGLLRSVEAVGNYGEMYERNLGRDSPLHIERGLNRLWNAGGLMYSPPVN